MKKRILLMVLSSIMAISASSCGSPKNQYTYEAFIEKWVAIGEKVDADIADIETDKRAAYEESLIRHMEEEGFEQGQEIILTGNLYSSSLMTGNSYNDICLEIGVEPDPSISDTDTFASLIVGTADAYENVDLWRLITCRSNDSRAILIPENSQITIKGELATQPQDCVLQKCTIIEPNLDSFTYSPNISDYAEGCEFADEDILLVGEVKEILPQEDMPSYGEESDPLYILLSDGITEVPCKITSQRYGEIKEGDKIALIAFYNYECFMSTRGYYIFENN